MDITKIDQPTLDLMTKAFAIVLEQNKVSYKKIGIVEEGDQLLFLYEGKDEKVHVFKWSKASSVGVSIGVLAQSVLMPILPHLRLLS
ncbi:hypothetical protein V7161_05035 [Neobacillus drentensis]|uniref:hypothetical protein n=1 Tax=Bacillales TaxID=1385 RepID=UPI001CBD2F20|nr:MULTISPECIES: hypothetical protein [Bacillales]MDN3014994.1 hypothetical protein [Paenibacillus sp. BSR1-1]